MIPLLILAAGAAALELKRLAKRPQGIEETRALLEKEKHLTQVLQELRKELEKERDEHAAAAARGDAMQQQAEALSEEKRKLEGLRDELSSEVAALSQRAEALAESAEALLSEKYSAQKKLEALKVESEQDAAKRAEQEEELRREVAEALESFGTGELDAESLLAELHDLGIKVNCTAEQLLTRRSADTSEGQQQHDWRQSARLLCGSSEQIARLIAPGSLSPAPSIDRAAAAMRGVSMTPRDASMGTPRLGLTSSAVAALTPRLFTAKAAAKEVLPTAAKLSELKENQRPAVYNVEASALHFSKPSKGAAACRPPTVPKLGLNVALGSSSIPATEPASLASYAFPSDVESAHPSTEVIHRP
ncbi:hypothetical protein CVIRNUC_003856 [Coccomyxa viridis]|uniref:Uncharacterized protein n=1 Tax=Coccomyxa viridis TaxID=1274662 RepID=A0AAV1I1B4_9CHLO|nr:hypothetical protein CVIRNUC_003856 [Coccomyxa viridis]